MILTWLEVGVRNTSEGRPVQVYAIACRRDSRAKGVQHKQTPGISATKVFDHSLNSVIWPGVVFRNGFSQGE